MLYSATAVRSHSCKEYTTSPVGFESAVFGSSSTIETTWNSSPVQILLFAFELTIFHFWKKNCTKQLCPLAPSLQQFLPRSQRCYTVKHVNSLQLHFDRIKFCCTIDMVASLMQSTSVRHSEARPKPNLFNTGRNDGHMILSTFGIHSVAEWSGEGQNNMVWQRIVGWFWEMRV